MTNAHFELGLNNASAGCVIASKPNTLARYLKSLSDGEVSSTNFEDVKRSILQAPFTESFLVLVGSLKNEDPGEHDVEAIFQLLSGLIFEGDHFLHLLGEFCGSKPTEEASLCGDQLVLLPDTAANSSKNELKQFTEKIFYTRLAELIVEVLRTAANSSSRYDFTALGKILGRVCKRSHGPSYIMPVLTSYVIRLESGDYRSRKFVWQLFSAVSNDYLDSVVIAVLNYCPNWKLVSSFLGDLAIQRDVCRNLFLDKFVNAKCFDKNQFVCNLIGYLVGPETSRQCLLNEICEKLISLWKDLFVIHYCPFAQLLYINKCVVLAVHRHPHPENLIVFNADVIQGITNYLKSSFENVKILGAYVGQILCNKINATTTSKKLDLSCNNSEKDINSIANDIESVINQFEKQEFEDPMIPNNSNVTIGETIRSGEKRPPEIDSVSSKVNVSKGSRDSDTDSDDDLLPYDMSNDVARPNFVKSFYLQDILSNLMGEEASKKPELFEQTITDAEKIIQRAEDAAISELCVEVAKLLLHVEDKYSTCGFEGYRVGALTALLTRQPEKMSSYLIQQFYASDYSIRHRLDILQTIRNGVLKLSSTDNQPTTINSCEPNETAESHRVPEWRKIVDARVLSKTKFYRSANIKREAAVSNKFAAICGCFFFPFLAEYDKPMRTLQLQNEDSHLFSNLLYTLGIVVYYAANSLVLGKMVQTLLGEFCWSFIKHSDAAVRQSVWFCAVMSALALKPCNFSSDDCLLRLLLSYRLSAIEVQANDSHAECVDLAKHFISCLNNLINKSCQT